METRRAERINKLTQALKPKYKWILIRQWNRVLNLAWIKAPLSHKLNMVICRQIILLKYNPFFI